MRDYDTDELKQLLQKYEIDFQEGKVGGDEGTCKLPTETDEGTNKYIVFLYQLHFMLLWNLG